MSFFFFFFSLSGPTVFKMSWKNMLYSKDEMKQPLVSGKVVQCLSSHDNICHEVHVLCHLALFKAILIKSVVIH